MSKWVIGNVMQIINWTENLFSLIFNAPIDSFIAGQFTKLRLKIGSNYVQRAYSYVNAPNNKNLEFYLAKVPEGKLSFHLHKLKIGDKIIVAKQASGFFILDNIPTCDNLWMLSTGTAIGPFLSILEQGTGLKRFKKIILVHATRYAKELNYLPQMLELQYRYNGKLNIQTIVSREKVSGSLTGRINNLILDGSLEDIVSLKLTAEKSHVMLCGNPQMVLDTQKVLKSNYGMRKHFKNDSGHISSENYW